TVYVRNETWWGKFDGNVTEFVFTPIASDSTRTAALLAGDIDLTHDAPPQDLQRLASDPKVRLSSALENRVIFFGFDQLRDELLYSNVKGRNPFKDARVREAFARAIDSELLKQTVMRGQSAPTGCMTTAVIGCVAKELESRPRADPELARKLLA